MPWPQTPLPHLLFGLALMLAGCALRQADYDAGARAALQALRETLMAGSAGQPGGSSPGRQAPGVLPPSPRNSPPPAPVGGGSAPPNLPGGPPAEAGQTPTTGAMEEEVVLQRPAIREENLDLPAPGTPGPVPGPDAAKSSAAPPHPGPPGFIVLDDVSFEFDSAVITVTQRPTRALAWLLAHPEASLVIEGHCDERGTNEYNLALGERRALAVKAYLVAGGVDPSRLKTISYGEERPFVLGHDESAWRWNRRAHLVPVVLAGEGPHSLPRQAASPRRPGGERD